MTSKEVIKLLINRKKVKQDDFAKMCGMKGQTNINSALNRSASMRVDTLEKMAKALGYEVVLRPLSDDGEEFVLHEGSLPDQP